MRPARLVRYAAVGAACGLVLVSALAATNTVSASRAERDVTSITVDQKKPKPDCNGITVTAIVTGGGNGGNADELVIGLAAADGNLRGQNGNDCILGGGGNDTLRGDNGTDICIGGPGTDTFHATCETQIQ
jgi:Ca2+-binding RTX toxin-like protein